MVLPGIGKLECRPVLPGEFAILLPTVLTQDRIGYVAVGFCQQLDSVDLLGFASAMVINEPPQILPLAQLQSLDALVNVMHK